MLNDPNLPLGGPGRSIKGLFALTEFKVVASSSADKKGKEVKIKSGDSRIVNPPEKALDAIFDDKTSKKRVTGPIQYAIDGKDDTAWTIDIGPGRSNVPQEAVFVLEKPIALGEGHDSYFQAGPEARRLEQRRQPEQQPRPLPVSV